jgi:hypothetical protein
MTSIPTKKNKDSWEWLDRFGIKDNEDSFDSILMSLTAVSHPSCLMIYGDAQVVSFPNDPMTKATFILAQWHADQHTTIEEVRSYVDRLLERLGDEGLTITQQAKELEVVS